MVSDFFSFAFCHHSKQRLYILFDIGIHFSIVVGPLQRVRPRNGILGLVVLVVVVLPLRSEFIGEL